jgi:hypothetical protein
VSTLREILLEHERRYRGLRKPDFAKHFNVGEKRYRDWLKGELPGYDSLWKIAEVTGRSQVEVFLAAGLLTDASAANLALRAGQTRATLTRALLQMQAFLADAEGALPTVVAATGRWEVVSVPHYRTVTLDDGGVAVHYSDHIGFRPLTFNGEVPPDVMKEFAGPIVATAAMPEDEPQLLAELRRHHPRFSAWFAVNRLMEATRAPLPGAVDLSPARRLQVIGTHFGGQDQVGALLARALGWGYANTSFLAASIHGRALGAADAEERARAQRRHDANALMIAESVVGQPDFLDHVLSLGNPNVLVDVAKLVKDSRRTDERVVLFCPGPGLAEMAQERTKGRPDEVDAGRMVEEAEKAAALLAPRERDNTAMVLRTDARPDEPAFFEQHAAQFAEVYAWLMEHHGAPVPADETYRALVTRRAA